jgi:hypothetical protein
MSVAENIMIAEEKVAGLQSQLRTVETVLEKAEMVAVKGEKAGRGLRRILRILLLLSVIAVAVMVVKKLIGSRSSEDDAEALDPDSTPDSGVADPGDKTPAGETDGSDRDTNAS